MDHIQSAGFYEGYGVIEAIPQSVAPVAEDEPLLRPSQTIYRNGDQLQVTVHRGKSYYIDYVP